MLHEGLCDDPIDPIAELGLVVLHDSKRFWLDQGERSATRRSHTVRHDLRRCARPSTTQLSAPIRVRTRGVVIVLKDGWWGASTRNHHGQVRQECVGAYYVSGRAHLMGS